MAAAVLQTAIARRVSTFEAITGCILVYACLAGFILGLFERQVCALAAHLMPVLLITCNVMRDASFYESAALSGAAAAHTHRPSGR